MYASAPPKPAMIRFSIAASSILPLVAQVFIAPTSSRTRPVAIAAAITCRPSNGSSMIAKGMTLAWQTRYVRTTCNVRTIQAVGCYRVAWCGAVGCLLGRCGMGSIMDALCIAALRQNRGIPHSSRSSCLAQGPGRASSAVLRS